MGKWAQPILVIAGTIIGAEFGYPMLGAFLGGLAGQLLFPTQLPTQRGPRLSDTSTTISNVGSPIPRGWGTFPASGCIIVQTDIREVIESSSVGKGGPSQTTETPTYYQTFAIGINDGPIEGVRVIWANGKPIYDRRPQGATESATAYTARQLASAQLESQFTLYVGSESQTPDPDLEAFYGVGNISAFRGLAYIVFPNWQNKAEDGNRMPSMWKFEVYTSSTTTSTAPIEYAEGTFPGWLDGVDPRVNTDAVSLLSAVPFYNYAMVTGGTGTFTTLNALTASIASGGQSGVSAHPRPNIVACAEDKDGTSEDAMAARSGDRSAVYLLLGAFRPTEVTELPSGSSMATVLALAVGTKVWLRAAVGTGWNAGSMGQVYNLSDPAGTDSARWQHSGTDAGFPTKRFAYTDNVLVRLIQGLKDPPDPCVGRPDIPGATDYCVSAAGRIARKGAFTRINTGSWKVLKPFVTTAGGSGLAYVLNSVPLGPLLPSTDPSYSDSAFWTAAYDDALLRGLVPGGWVYGTDYPTAQSYGWQRDSIPTTSTVTASVPVAEVAAGLCLEAGLTVLDFDTAALAGLTVRGYVRTGVMPARQAIDPLRQATFFDGVESNGKIVFRPRGADVVATITLDDLGAVVEGAGSQGSALTISEAQDVDLPRCVRVHYLSESRDYETGEQDSPNRLDINIGVSEVGFWNPVNDVDVQLPIVLTDLQAREIAQVLWANAWTERLSYTTIIDGANQALEPADPIAIPVDGVTQRVRIVDITDSFPATRTLNMLADDAAGYRSVGVVPDAGAVPITRPHVTVVLPAEALFLDIPLLRDADNDPGFYAAIFGALPTSFAGAGLYRSVDGGGSYLRISTSGASAAITGTLLGAVPAGPTDVFDEIHSFMVELFGPGPLNNASESAVLGGANACAVGVDGRWELLQFKTATFISGTVYKLSGLLRGRRGTEWAVGLSVVGDKFVFLSGVVRVPLETAQINHSYLYKTVGVGTSIDSATAHSFTGHAVDLRPFSPAHLSATRDAGSGDWTVAWVRRGRIGQTLQDGTDVAVNEATEAYQVDIYNGSTVVRTISVGVQTAVYTSANQTSDFGSPQTSLKVAVYQISAVVGRGYAAGPTTF